MKMKTMAQIVLLAFVAVSIAYVVVQGVQPQPATGSVAANTLPAATAPSATASQQSATTPAPSATTEASVGDRKVVAYYFHGDKRCTSCMTIEAYSKEAVDTSFADALKAGGLEWKVVNVDTPGNEHFVDDYKLYTKSLVLVEYAGGKQVRYKNLEGVWDLLNDKDGFEAYVRDEVRAFLSPGA